MDNNYYKLQSAFSEVYDYNKSIEKLPCDVGEICKFVQNNLIHSYWIERYGCKIQDSIRYSEMQIRYANDLLKKSEAKAKSPVTEKHLPVNRVVSVCRDFSLLLCSILREKGIASRIRCGFSKYLTPGRYEDHWVCEYWSEPQSRWIMVDAQLDDIHREVLQYQFNECDVPNSEFVYAGKAWQLCRDSEEDPSQFGIFELNGFSFIKGNIVRDLYALNKLELMAWDTGWGILKDPSQAIEDEDEYQLLDKLAILSCNSDFLGAKKAVESLTALKFPEGWDISQAPTISELLSPQVEV
jgi:hypothetical protein